jgi:hypothetical protein
MKLRSQPEDVNYAKCCGEDSNIIEGLFTLGSKGWLGVDV